MAQGSLIDEYLRYGMNLYLQNVMADEAARRPVYGDASFNKSGISEQESDQFVRQEVQKAEAGRFIQQLAAAQGKPIGQQPATPYSQGTDGSFSDVPQQGMQPRQMPAQKPAYIPALATMEGTVSKMVKSGVLNSADASRIMQAVGARGGNQPATAGPQADYTNMDVNKLLQLPEDERKAAFEQTRSEVYRAQGKVDNADLDIYLKKLNALDPKGAESVKKDLMRPIDEKRAKEFVEATRGAVDPDTFSGRQAYYKWLDEQELTKQQAEYDADKQKFAASYADKIASKVDSEKYADTYKKAYKYGEQTYEGTRGKRPGTQTTGQPTTMQSEKQAPATIWEKTKSLFGMTPEQPTTPGILGKPAAQNPERTGGELLPPSRTEQQAAPTSGVTIKKADGSAINPADYKGRTINVKGQIYISDGEKWYLREGGSARPTMVNSVRG